MGQKPNEGKCKRDIENKGVAIPDDKYNININM